ncbi:MAG: hypothetical protein NT126_04255, partial [Bacteroidetes bacterium]|nr:hypothetical protein [Bacteroidota bacterium]
MASFILLFLSMKRSIFTFFLILIISNCFSQGINNLWLMGYTNWHGLPWGGIDMNFSGGLLNVNYHNRIMNFGETNGEICDNNGNLLFSSNGIFIANAINDTMLNGSGLNPSYYTNLHDSDGLFIGQGNLVIPFPGNSSMYYLFHSTVDDYGNTWCALHLYYSLIDMTQDSGRGSVIQKNIVLLNDSIVPGRLTACKHANGRDWWIICHEYNTNRYYKFLITPQGIIGSGSQNIGVVRDSHQGQCVFSPDGSRFAYYEPIVGDLDILNFDRCTGDFSNLVHVDINDSATSGGGAAFSPNSKVLYLSSMNYVYQFNTDTTNISATQTTVAIYDGYNSPFPPFATSFYLSQIAPNGKIYVNCSNSTQAMHVINYPDSIGLGCNVCQHCIQLPAYNGFTIANHPNYFLGAKVGSMCDTVLSVQNIKEHDSNFQLFPNPVVNDEVTFT